MPLAKKPKIDTDKIVNAIKSTPQVIDLITKAGVAYYGWKTVDHPAGALVGLVGLKLATSDNVVSGLSGVATLGAIGLTQIVKSIDYSVDTVSQAIVADTYKKLIRKLLRLPPIM